MRSFNRQVLILCAVVSTSGLLLAASRGADPEHVARLKETRNCVRCDLSEADLSGMSLPKSDLTGADLTGTKMYKVDLTEADLSYANLTNADLTGANLTGAKGAVLTSAKTTERTTCPDGSAGPCK